MSDLDFDWRNFLEDEDELEKQKNLYRMLTETQEVEEPPFESSEEKEQWGNWAKAGFPKQESHSEDEEVVEFDANEPLQNSGSAGGERYLPWLAPLPFLAAGGAAALSAGSRKTKQRK